MSFFRQVYELMMSATQAHARWDYEVSMSIINNRKKLLLLGVLLLPILLVSFSDAASFLGSRHAYGPSFYSTSIFVVSIFVGIAAGLITGCIGAGGGFVITPALMAVGVKGILAVGTDMFHIFAKAIMGTVVHKKLGNISLGLAFSFLVGSTIGTFLGGELNRFVYDLYPILSDAVISIIYSIVLGFLGFYALFDYFRLSRAIKKGTIVSGSAHGSSGAGMTPLARTLQKVKLAPMITFDQEVVPGGRRISGWVMAVGGLIVGLLATLMGAGGGFVTFPMFVYGFGVSSMTTVGTDILQIIFTSGFGSILQYAIYGYVFYTLALGMLIGSLLGIQIGALTTKVVKGVHIRGFYAVSILAGFVNRMATLPNQFVRLGYIKLDPSLVAGIEYVGNIAFWIVVIFFSVWIFAKFFAKIGYLRQEA